MTDASDWPRDLRAGACRSCYDERGVDVPAEQCRRHAVTLRSAKQVRL